MSIGFLSYEASRIGRYAEVGLSDEDNWSMGPQEGLFLCGLLSAIHARVVVEIGTNIGHSALFICHALRAVGHKDAVLHTFEIRDCAETARRHLVRFGYDSLAHVHQVASTSPEAARIRDQIAPIDLILIDGDHSFEGSYNDFLFWSDALRPGALLIFHDISEAFEKIYLETGLKSVCTTLKTIEEKHPGFSMLRMVPPHYHNVTSMAVVQKTGAANIAHGDRASADDGPRRIPMQSVRWNKQKWEDAKSWQEEWKDGYAWGTQDSVQRDFQRFVAPLVPTDGKPRILEIACGMGRFTELLLEVAEHVHGIDLAEHCVESCRERFPERFTATTTDGVTLPEGDFDLVLSYDSLVHADFGVLAAYFEQAQDRLVPGGYIGIHHANRPDREASRTPVTSGMVVDLIYGLPELEMVSQTLFRVRDKSFIDCFTVARRVGSQEDPARSGAPTADEASMPAGDPGAGQANGAGKRTGEGKSGPRRGTRKSGARRKKP